MDTPDLTLKQAIIEFYRGELRVRYQLDNVRRFEDFAPIPDADIGALRDYFLDVVYPPIAERDRLDFAIDHLGSVLRSPSRMRPLLGTALKSIWRMGTRLPAAVSAGLATVDAYRESRKLESIMLSEANRLGLTLRDTRHRDRMIQIIASVPERDVKRLIADILTLFRALSNVPMLETAADLMRLFIDTMKKNPDYFCKEDMDGVTTGLSVIEGGLSLFRQLKPEDFQNIIQGIERVEYDWYERVVGEARAAMAG